MLKWLIVLIMLLACILAGCANTCRGFGTLVKGVGQDIESAVDSQERSGHENPD